MIYRSLNAVRRRLDLAIDYGLVAIRNPRLFRQAISYTLNRRYRGAQAVLRADNFPQHTGIQQTTPVSAKDLLWELARKSGVICLRSTSDSHSIGVADTDILVVLGFLLQNAHDPKIAIDRKSVDYAKTDLRRLISKAQKIHVTFSVPQYQRHRFEIEVYFRKQANEWISNNNSNSALRALRDDRLLNPGLTDVAEILNGQTLTDRLNDQPVDAVYTWVNHNDSEWISARAEYEGDAGSETDANSIARFHNNDELRYSLRSLARNAPWVRRIFVVTNCARPSWLNEASERLIWVDHSAIIPPENLPTFNSHVIESCLHKISGLSENFIYLNDDVFLGRRVPKNLFFDINGAGKSFLESYGMVSGDTKEGDPDYLNASRNVAALLRDEMGFVPTQLHQHTIFALRKSVLEEIENRWQNHIDKMRKNRFRTSEDLNVTSFLYHHYALGTGKGQIGSIKNIFIKSQDIRWRNKLQAAEKSNYDTLCINEGGNLAPSPEWHATIRDFLEKRYPDKPEWEY